MPQRITEYRALGYDAPARDVKSAEGDREYSDWTDELALARADAEEMASASPAYDEVWIEKRVTLVGDIERVETVATENKGRRDG